jgi:adenylate kinase
MIYLILFGPPGSGKGTQAAMLIEKFGLLHISTGELFRYEIRNETPLGLKAKEYIFNGQLVPDELTIEMLKRKVDANQHVNGIIFDGFPRTLRQAEALDEFLAEKGEGVTLLVSLDVPEDELIHRILERGKTSHRMDDSNEAIIRNRIAVYLDETSPIFKHYEEKDKAVLIDGTGSKDEIFARLTDSIEALV